MNRLGTLILVSMLCGPVFADNEEYRYIPYKIGNFHYDHQDNFGENGLYIGPALKTGAFTHSPIPADELDAAFELYNGGEEKYIPPGYTLAIGHITNEYRQIVMDNIGSIKSQLDQYNGYFDEMRENYDLLSKQTQLPYDEYMAAYNDLSGSWNELRTKYSGLLDKYEALRQTLILDGQIIGVPANQLVDDLNNQ